jgi:CRISPR type III-A-associated protein Csm2
MDKGYHGHYGARDDRRKEQTEQRKSELIEKAKQIDKLSPEDIDNLAEQIAQFSKEKRVTKNQMRNMFDLIRRALTEKPDKENKKKNLLITKPKIAYMVKEPKTRELVDIMLPALDAVIKSHTDAGYANLKILNDGILGYFKYYESGGERE